METTWKWHNFLCGFGLWAGAAGCIGAASLVFNESRSPIGILLVSIYLAEALFSVMTAVNLIRRKFNGIVLLKVMYIFSIAVQAVSLFISFSVSGVVQLAMVIGMFAANNVYYRNREAYFSEEGIVMGQDARNLLLRLISGMLFLTAGVLQAAQYIRILSGIGSNVAFNWYISVLGPILSELLLGVGILSKKRALTLTGLALQAACSASILINNIQGFSDNMIGFLSAAAVFLAYGIALILLARRQKSAPLAGIAALLLVLGRLRSVISNVNTIMENPHFTGVITQYMRNLAAALLVFAAFGILVFNMNNGEAQADAPDLPGDGQDNRTV